MLIHDLVARNAWERPDGDAVVFEDGTRRSWKELETRSLGLGRALHDLGVRRGDRVALLARNCLESFDLFIACSHLGAIYAPINYRFAVPEIEYVLADSEPRVFVAAAEYADTVEQLRRKDAAAPIGAWVGFDGDVPGAESLEDLIAGAEGRPPAVELSADDPSWICYTGGTTGRSKGVLLSHRNMLAGAANFAITNRATEANTYLVAGALFHIALVVPLGYWLVGGRTVIMNFEPARALELMARERVTNLVATGTILKMLVEEMEARPRDDVHLINMDTGGAPVAARTAERAMKAFGCTLAQIYGQTESALMATYLTPEEYSAGVGEVADEEARALLNSTGRAAPLCEVRAMDGDGQLLPPDAVGEIVVRGDNVMLGYWNKPELNAEALAGDWLRTGDLGYVTPRGHVHLVDRKKDMIITGGENVYTSEVELTLAEHEDIAEGVVIGIPDDHWGERVHAIVVAREGHVVDENQVREFCRARLAGYKVPKGVEVRDGLPRLPTGKIAKGNLREEYWRGLERRVHGS